MSPVAQNLPTEVITASDAYITKINGMLINPEKWPEPLDAMFQLEVPEERTYYAHFIADMVDLYQIGAITNNPEYNEHRSSYVLHDLYYVIEAAEFNTEYYSDYAVRHYHVGKKYKRLYKDFNLKSDLI